MHRFDGSGLVHRAGLMIVAGLISSLGFGPTPGHAQASTGDAQSVADWDGIVRDSAGITIVENFGKPLWRDEEAWSFSEVLKIGSAGGEPEYQFGRITGLRALSDGRIVVADAHAHRVMFYSPDGVHQLTVGTSGSGPRDFGSGRLRLVTSRDTIMVMDYANNQAHWLAPDGTWLGSWRIITDDGWYMNGLDDAPTGQILGRLRPVPTPDPSVIDTLDLLVLRDVRGAMLDTLARVPQTKSRRNPQETFVYAGVTDFDLKWNGGVVSGRGDQYRWSVYDANGDLERIIILDRESAPFTARDRSVFLDWVDDEAVRRGAPQGVVSRFKDTIHFEDTYPAFRGFRTGPHGTLWVQQVKPLTALSDEEKSTLNLLGIAPASPEWDVFDREGRYLGVVLIPPVFNPIFSGDKVYGIWTDELDVQYVQIMRINGLPPVGGD